MSSPNDRINAIVEGAEVWDDGSGRPSVPSRALAGDGASSRKPNGRPSRRGAGGESGEDGGRRIPQREQIVRLVGDRARFWHAPDSEAYAAVEVESHRENHPVRSRSFRRWLCGLAWREGGFAPGGQALEDAVRVFEALSAEGPEQSPWLRIGHRDGDWYLDLGDADWRVVQITAHSGWRVLDRHDCPFVRGVGSDLHNEPEV